MKKADVLKKLASRKKMFEDYRRQLKSPACKQANSHKAAK